LLLVTGILVLIFGFGLINCGHDPLFKVALSDNGPFAIDLSLAPDPFGVFFSKNLNFASVADTELTVEAWVKSMTPSLNGTIFGRIDAAGVAMFVNNNEPKFIIKRAPLIPVTVGCTRINATSTECIVDSNASIAQDVWTHIAGVITNEDQSSGPDDCANVGSEKPHLAIYINGNLQNCSTTGSQFADNPSSAIIAIGTTGESPDTLDNGEIKGSTRLRAAIDEVRIWTVARTSEQIKTCMGQELSFTVMGDCYIDSTILKGYWRFNEGEDSAVADFSGGGSSGGMEISETDPESEHPTKPWVGGWIFPGAPITRDPG
jgi:hypothetical protein